MIQHRNQTCFKFFKTASTLLYSEIEKLDDDALVKHLKQFPKKVSALPGALEAMANEVLAHHAAAKIEPNTSLAPS